jgi:hypothetical protein
MKLYVVLKPFKGSQTGHDVQAFTPDDKPIHISDALAAIALKEGWITPYEPVTPAEARDTKVIEPKETKPVKAKTSKK